MAVTLELLTVGRVSVDLYPEQIGVPLEEVRAFRKMLGGSPANVAVAAARLGRRTALVTKVGDDPFGRYVRRALEEFGVEASRVGTHPSLRTPLAFCEVFPPDRFPLLFYRAPRAPDLELEPGDIDLEAVASVPLFWTTGTGLSEEPSRSTTLEALERRGRRQVTVHDLDYRAAFWSRTEEAAGWNRRALAHATVAVGNEDEVAVVLGERLEPREAASALLELGVELAVVKLGGAGVLAATSSTSAAVPAVAVEVVNGLGAGDAFGGALCHGLLAGWPLERTLRFANAAGAIVASRLGCADEMPTLAEVEALCEA
ncbi:MAG: 5-dehydro-2-deoxygluconokinase [Thermoleophilia bacterium]|nr:5-dehydro-2-deoxygluconokinase [Thermoleophilia bacterium]